MLVQRIRDDDDKQLCLECAYLGGNGRVSRRCGNWQAVNKAVRVWFWQFIIKQASGGTAFGLKQ